MGSSSKSNRKGVGRKPKRKNGTLGLPALSASGSTSDAIVSVDPVSPTATRPQPKNTLGGEERFQDDLVHSRISDYGRVKKFPKGEMTKEEMDKLGLGEQPDV